mmetsp:Transcript_20801/g.43600  ORF Transcript_20801/g.43600 Transcript_20801/m.43600 type:complete len:161 (+) Transcript_20801:120-602(+)
MVVIGSARQGFIGDLRSRLLYQKSCVETTLSESEQSNVTVSPHGSGIDGGLLCEPEQQPPHSTPLHRTALHRTESRGVLLDRAARHRSPPETARGAVECRPFWSAVGRPTVHESEPCQRRGRPGSSDRGGARTPIIALHTDAVVVFVTGNPSPTVCGERR